MSDLDTSPPDGLPDPHDDLLNPRTVFRSFLGTGAYIVLFGGLFVRLLVELSRLAAQSPGTNLYLAFAAAALFPWGASAAVLLFTRFTEGPDNPGATAAAIAIGAIAAFGLAEALDYVSYTGVALILSGIAAGLVTFRLRLRGPVPFDVGFGMVLGFLLNIILSVGSVDPGAATPGI